MSVYPKWAPQWRIDAWKRMKPFAVDRGAANDADFAEGCAYEDGQPVPFRVSRSSIGSSDQRASRDQPGER